MKKFCFLLLVFVLLGATSVSAQVTFTRNLYLGISGEDVRLLQQTLNKDVRTRLANTGAGSPGNETAYFGPLTHNAVVRFQELYAVDVLIPVGLSKGTGYFGPSTRAHIATLEMTDEETGPSLIQPGVSPQIFSVEPTRGRVGTTITITGEGFAPENNAVVTIFEEFTGVASPDGKTLEVTLQGPFPKDFIEKNQHFYNEFKVEIPYGIVVRTSVGASEALPFQFILYEE